VPDASLYATLQRGKEASQYMPLLPPLPTGTQFTEEKKTSWVLLGEKKK
jgi:hypothetical protein